MVEQLLEIKATLQVQREPSEVHEAIIDPAKMSNYFISNGSGRLEEGNKVMWKFPEFDMTFPVFCGRIERDSYISFKWGEAGHELLVEISLIAAANNSTIVTVTEKSMKNDEAGIKWLKSNTEGWANFLACLKAWLEYGINLRKGAFDFMSDKK
jgi:uncharacterized protein YndB with AHSA1/START domain